LGDAVTKFTLTKLDRRVLELPSSRSQLFFHGESPDCFGRWYGVHMRRRAASREAVRDLLGTL